MKFTHKSLVKWSRVSCIACFLALSGVAFSSDDFGNPTNVDCPNKAQHLAMGGMGMAAGTPVALGGMGGMGAMAVGMGVGTPGTLGAMGGMAAAVGAMGTAGAMGGMGAMGAMGAPAAPAAGGAVVQNQKDSLAPDNALSHSPCAKDFLVDNFQ